MEDNGLRGRVLHRAFCWRRCLGGEWNLPEITQRRVPGAGVRKYFRTHGNIRFGGGRAANWASGSGSVAAKLDLTAENTGSGTLAHEEKNKVCRIAAELQTCANAFEGHHGWGAPGPVKRFAAATRHHTSAVAATQSEGELQDRRQNNDAFGLVENTFGNTVRDCENFLHYLSGAFDTIGFLVLRQCGKSE